MPAMRTKWAMHSGSGSLTVRSVVPTDGGFKIEGNASPHAEVDPPARIRVGASPANVKHLDWSAPGSAFVIEIAGEPVYGEQVLGIWLGDDLWGTFDLFEV